MRILQVVPDLRPDAGGPSRSVPELCSALSSAGIEVTLYTTGAPNAPMTLDPAEQNYAVRVFERGRDTLRGVHALYRAVRASAKNFDLIHIHSLWNSVATVSAAAARRAGVPYIIAPRGMLDPYCISRKRALKRAYAATLDRRTVEGAARLHCLNIAEARSLVPGWFRYPECAIAPNGIDLGNCAAASGEFRRSHPEFEGRRLMLFLGRLHPIKGLGLQLEALQLLRPRHPDLVWVLIGPDEGEWPRLAAAAHAAGLEDSVRWIGLIAGPERFSALADADVVVQTSWYECHSMTVNEALGVGVPLVITRSVHFDEVEEAGAGCVVDHDARSLAAAIESILIDPALARKMRLAGQRFAADHLAWPKIAQRLGIAYLDVISHSETRRACVE